MANDTIELTELVKQVAVAGDGRVTIDTQGNLVLTEEPAAETNTYTPDLFNVALPIKNAPIPINNYVGDEPYKIEGVPGAQMSSVIGAVNNTYIPKNSYFELNVTGEVQFDAGFILGLTPSLENIDITRPSDGSVNVTCFPNGSSAYSLTSSSTETGTVNIGSITTGKTYTVGVEWEGTNIFVHINGSETLVHEYKGSVLQLYVMLISFTGKHVEFTINPDAELPSSAQPETRKLSTYLKHDVTTTKPVEISGDYQDLLSKPVLPVPLTPTDTDPNNPTDKPGLITGLQLHELIPEVGTAGALDTGDLDNQVMTNEQFNKAFGFAGDLNVIDDLDTWTPPTGAIHRAYAANQTQNMPSDATNGTVLWLPEGDSKSGIVYFISGGGYRSKGNIFKRLRDDGAWDGAWKEQGKGGEFRVARTPPSLVHTVTAEDSTGASAIVYSIRRTGLTEITIPRIADMPSMADIGEIIIASDQGGAKFVAATNVTIEGGDNELAGPGGTLRAIHLGGDLWRVEKSADSAAGGGSSYKVKVIIASGYRPMRAADFEEGVVTVFVQSGPLLTLSIPPSHELNTPNLASVGMFKVLRLPSATGPVQLTRGSGAVRINGAGANYDYNDVGMMTVTNLTGESWSTDSAPTYNNSGLSVVKDWTTFSGTSLNFFSGIDTSNGYVGWVIEIENLQCDTGATSVFTYQGSLVFKVSGTSLTYVGKASRGYVRTSIANEGTYLGGVFYCAYSNIVANAKIKLSSDLTSGLGGLFLQESNVSCRKSDTNTNMAANSSTRMSFRSPQVPNQLFLSFPATFTCKYRIVKPNF